MPHDADTRVLVNSTQGQIRAEAERCMALGRDCPDLLKAVGNYIPPNTPVGNALCHNGECEGLCRRWSSR